MRIIRRFIAASVFLSLLLASVTASADTFTMNESFLRTMFQSQTIQPVFRVRMNHNGPLHSLDTDCEMHMAGTVLNANLGTPSAIVVEFPNWCKFNPQGQLGQSFNSLSGIWNSFFTGNVQNKNCDVKGFLRIFCEHCQGSGGASNPNHAYEYHPALSMTCAGETFSFGDMLRSFPNLRHISPSTASQCIRERKLEVRFKNNRYEFRESGGGTCGNFAVVRINSINMDWSFALDGGHYTFADVTAHGQHGGLGIYTLSGSDPDTWLGQAIGQGGLNQSKVMHGVFTYDWESIIGTLIDEQGNFLRPSQWTEVEFPLALIAYGETSETP